MLTLLLAACTEVSTEQNPTTEPSSEQTKETEPKEQKELSKQAEDTQSTMGQQMSVHFIDVGQGDAILIQSPIGKTMLIDGGVKGAGDDIVRYLREQGVTTLDYVVATHPDADHIGGLISVLDSISIENFIDSGKVHTSQTFEEMLTLIQGKNIPYTVPKTGDTINFDQQLTVKVLNADEHATDNNEASIVLRISYGEISFLLMGDAGVALEKEMLAHGDVRATILKAGHHGSNTSSSQAFLNAVSPKATILSYGQDNKYGHPHAEVIDYLQAVDSDIYSTAEAGTIVITTDGVTYDTDAALWTGIGATSSIQPKAATSSTGKVEIVSKDLQTEIVGIKNNGQDAVQLEGWQLISVEGNQGFKFPPTTLRAGQTIFVTSGSDAKTSADTLEWTKRQIWLNSGDAAQLQNAKGEVVSEFQ